MATIEHARLLDIIRECDMATGGGRCQLTRETLAEVCSLATPFGTWSARWVSGDNGGDELEIYNLDTGPDASKASGARFWPRADHDTDAAIELAAKLVPYPYRLDLTIMETDRSPDHILNTAPLARLQKLIDGKVFETSCQATVAALAILGVALKAAALIQTANERQARREAAALEELPPMEDLPPLDTDDPLPIFEDLPA